ncbi:MAG: hypothetical protein ABF904_13810 [Ethanoligenens sp.]
MLYADYDYYTGTFYGRAIKEDDFPALIRDASAFIDRLTFRRVPAGQPPPNAVSMAACAVAERIQTAQQSGALNTNAALKSENTDGYSATYNTLSDTRAELYADYADAAGPYLYGTGWLYAGVDFGGDAL